MDWSQEWVFVLLRRKPKLKAGEEACCEHAGVKGGPAGVISRRPPFTAAGTSSIQLNPFEGEIYSHTGPLRLSIPTST